MSRFFAKYVFVFFVSLTAYVDGYGQILDNANLNLNIGGYINDVTYDADRNYYIVVGNFTTINGFARKNIAFLNGTTLAVETQPHLIPITNIDGEIRTVEITRTLTSGFPDFYTYHLYIGGNFQTVTIGASNYTRLGIAKLTSTLPLILPITYSNFAVSAWNADLDMTPLITGAYSQGVDDIIIVNDTVIFSGKFLGVNNSTAWTQRDGIAAFSVSGALLAYPAMASSGLNTGRRFYCIRKEYSNLYVGGYVSGGGLGNGKLYKLDAAGNIAPGFTFNDGLTWAIYSIDFLEDSLLLVTADYNSENTFPDGLRVVRKTNGSVKLNHSLHPYSDGYISQVAAPINSITSYKNFVFANTGNASEYVVGVESESEGPLISIADWNAAVPTAITPNASGNVHVSNNKLFVTGSNLSVLSGQSKLRLGAYCLEPHDAINFTAFDTTVCPDNIVQYTIPTVPFADGYRWQYFGNGANLDGNIGADAGPVDIELSTGNSLNVQFLSTFTPGVLSVTPYSLCNGSTKIFSNTISINIHSNPLPHVNAGNDTAITCYNDSIGVQLYGYSDSVVTSYAWVYAFPDTNVTSQIDTAEIDGFYVFKVVNPLGCPNFDTVYVSMDTIAPALTLPAPPYELTCADPVQNFTGSSPTPNTVFEWYQGGTVFPNPISVNAMGTYYFVVTDTLNGCDSEAGIFVSTNFDPPNIQIFGYDTIYTSQPQDTLTCFQNSLSMTCYSDTANTTTSWINDDTTIFYGANINITAGEDYHIFATNNSNGCTNSLGIIISTDLNPPGVNAPLNSLLNCSTDSLILDGDSLSGGATLEWSGLLISPSPDPLTIYDAGTYYLSATNPSNGCASVDSVIISQDNSITVFAGNDTLVCDKALIPFNATYVGTISGINYVWSNGNTNQTANYTAGLQPYAAVTISGDGGCVGTDTVYMNLPPVPVITFEGFKPCGDGATGQIVATPVSGIEPFTYSIDDGINFQTTPVFTGLTIGTYPILVHDSLNCEYDFSATIDENSALPTPAFLFSTYNYETDTVVIIDVSNPPTDSTVWLFPVELIVLDNNPISPMILLPDTGAFSITMQAYYGDCLVEVTKMIYASPFDSLAATQYNLNGIKSIELYPNPTTGNFTVAVEFYSAQRSALVVQDMIGNTYVFEEYDESLIITQDIFLDNSVLDGTYVLKIVSEFDSGTITFILAR